MEAGGIVFGLQIEFIPALGVQIVHGMVLLAGKAEGPVAGRIGRDMGLVNARDREGGDDALVASEICEKFWSDTPGIYVKIEELP